MSMQTSRVSIEAWLGLFAMDLLLVLLVVLILFMVMTPILPDRIFVDLPVSTSAVKSPEYDYDLEISVARADFVFFDGQVSMPELDRRLASAPRDKDTVVRIRAGREVPFGTIRRIVQSARQAGYSRVTFMVLAPDRPASDFI